MRETSGRRLWHLTLFYGLALALTVVAADRGILHTSYLASLPAADKVGHFVLMGLMSYLLNTAFDGRRFHWRRVAVLKGSLLVAVFVTLEELSQVWIPHRTFDLVDLAADFAGIWVFSRWAHVSRRARPV